MSEGKRRFSLGDIVRKMNENEGRKEESSSPRPRFTRPVSQSNRPHEDASLPPQPRLERPESSTAEPSTLLQQEKRVLRASAPASAGPVEKTDTLPGYESTAASEHAGEDYDEGIDYLRYLSIILRRKSIIILTVLAVGIFSVFSYLRSEKYYTASASLLFQPGYGRILEGQSGWTYYRQEEKNLNTHLELLTSSAVLERVAENLGGAIAVPDIRGAIRVSRGETDGVKNNIINVRYRHVDPELSRDVANELCRTYIEYHRDVYAQENTRFILKLRTQIEKLEKGLAEKEDALREFKEKHRIVALSDRAGLVTSKASEIEMALQETQLGLLESRERLQTLKSKITQQDENIVQSMTYKNPYQDRIADLQLELATLIAEYSPDHYKVQRAENEIASLTKAMETEVSKLAVEKTVVKNPVREELIRNIVNLSLEISVLEAKRTALEQIIDKQNDEIRKLPGIELEYAHLDKDRRSMVETLDLLKRKLEEAKIEKDSKESDLRVFELANIPGQAVAEKKVSSIFMGLLVGLILGIGLAFLLEYLDQTLKDPGEVEKNLELPLLGVVPLIEADQSAVDTPGRLAKSVLEPFRALRANLKHLTGIHKAKVIMICSAVKGEGKTTLAGNLAITFAMDGKKVLLIDADLRRAQVHHYFNVDRGEGLVDLLLGERRPEDVERQTPHEGLSIITAGSKSHNPAELLGTYRFDEVIEELRSRADLVIFDSPAFLPVSDSLTMAPKMDAVVMIVRTLWTPLKAARQTRNQLKRMGAKILGGILNGVSHQHGYYPYYYGYYGYYAYKYTYSYDEDPPRKASMRQFGLRLEGKMREAVSNARFAVPQKVSRFSRFARRIARRPMFWLLVAAVAAVVGTRLYVESSSSGLINEFISPVEIDEPPSSAGPAIRIEKSHPARTTEIGSAKMDYPESVTQDNSHPNHRLLDSVAVWLVTVRKRDWPEVSRFYDSLDFSFPGGGYSEWTTEVRNNGMSFSDKADLFLGEGSAKRLSGHYCTTRRILYEVEKGDTLTHEIVMAWGKRNNSWKIIRQKIRKASES